MATRFWGDAALFVGRALIAVLFLGGAAQKVLSPADAQSLLAAHSLPVALIWPAMALNLAAGLLLVLGVYIRPLALVLALYCAVTSFFHLIPDDPWQMSIFVKNWSIAGGCLILAVAGSGGWSLHPDTQMPALQR